MEIPVYLIAGFLDAGKTNFINGILLGTPLIAPARDARRAIDLILTIYGSSISGTWEAVPLFKITI